MESGPSADTHLDVGIETGFAAVHWPVAETYELVVEQRLQPEPVIYRRGRDVEYRRIGPVSLVPALEALADATDEGVLAWVRSKGFVGIAGDPKVERESVTSIRGQAQHLRQTRALLRALRDRAPAATLLSLGAAAAGHLVDARHLARIAGAMEDELGGETVVGADAQLQAFHALAVALRDPLVQLARVTASIDRTKDGVLQLRPRVLGQGPLAIAYLELMAEASRLSLSWFDDVPEMRRSYPTTCRRCGRAFASRRSDARWCSNQCRWAGTKAATRHAKRNTEVDDV